MKPLAIVEQLAQLQRVRRECIYLEICYHTFMNLWCNSQMSCHRNPSPELSGIAPENKLRDVVKFTGPQFLTMFQEQL